MAEEGNKSSGDLFSSGKVVAEAAMSAFQQKSVENIDKKGAAAATADILDSATKYGKLEDKPVGQYFEKAEEYLKSYSSGGTEKAPAGDAPKPEAEQAAPPTEPTPAPAPAAEEGKSSEGFGVDYAVKAAESLVEKKVGGEESGGGGAGGLFKMAQGFMK